MWQRHSAFFIDFLKLFTIFDPMEKNRLKAIGLLSGGLDSSLALKIILDLGIEVVCLNLKTPFCTCDSKGKCSSSELSEKFNLRLIRIFGGEDYLKIIKNPKHGYGKNMNPCIDCRIFLFSKAKELMEKEKADFIFTGEVLGERPMSQRRDAMKLLEKQSGLSGLILRPLSAQLLEPTIPEKDGWIQREKLLAIKGRSRKPQISLAENLGISDYPCPAGGCLLTDANFAKRLKDSFLYNEDSLRHIGFLKIGRHFRLPSKAKVIAGRDETENKLLVNLSSPEELKFTVKGFRSTFCLLLGQKTIENQVLASAMCAKYCDQKGLDTLPVKIWTQKEDEFTILYAKPLDDKELEFYRI